MINDNGIAKYFKMMWRFEVKHSEFRNPHSEFRNPKSAFQGGFTLIEIIILIVMAGILLPIIIVPFVTGVRGSGKPEMATKAIYFAHQRMEELMKFNYGRTPDLDPTAGFVAFPTGDTNYPGEYEIVYVINDLSTPSGSPGVGYKRIIVRIRDPENSTYEVYAVVTNFP